MEEAQIREYAHNKCERYLELFEMKTNTKTVHRKNGQKLRKLSMTNIFT